VLFLDQYVEQAWRVHDVGADALIARTAGATFGMVFDPVPTLTAATTFSLNGRFRKPPRLRRAWMAWSRRNPMRPSSRLADTGTSHDGDGVDLNQELGA
jgi:hypothetical protein